MSEQTESCLLKHVSVVGILVRMIILSESEVRLPDSRDLMLDASGKVQHVVGVVHAHGGRLLVDLDSPGGQNLLEELERLHVGPGGKLVGVAQIPQILNITEQLGFEQGEGDDGNGAVLVHRSVVALQPGRKVGQVVGDLLDHQLPHLAAPDRLGRVVLSEKIVANFSGPWLSR